MPARASQPLFHQTYRAIADRIEQGEFGPGDRLPSERWFGDTLGVSRSTVRRAFDELVGNGIAEAEGRGVVVAPRRAATADRLVSLTELATARGLRVTARVLAAEPRSATLDEAEAFGIAAGAGLFVLERVRLLDGLEVSVDHDRVPLAVLPDAAAIDFTTASLYAELEAAGHEPAEARTQIEAAAASAAEAARLDLEPGAPLLVATDRTTDRSGRVLTLGRSAYRSDRHRFLATFIRSSPSSSSSTSPSMSSPPSVSSPRSPSAG